MNVVALKDIIKPNYYQDVEKYFTDFVEKLNKPESKTTELSELEQAIATEGRELLRLMLQANLNSRGLGDAQDTINGADYVTRNHKRILVRKIKTIFGVIEVERMGYGNRGVNSIFPLDSQLNLPDVMYSHELRHTVIKEVVRGSYDNAVESIKDYTGQKIPKQQVEQITVAAAADFDEFYQQKTTDEKINAANAAPIVVLTSDGKGVVMHKDDLRPATKKKANKLESRLSPGEKKNSKRMATVASVYNIEPYIRSPDDFKKELASVKLVENTPKPKPKPLAKRVWASVEKDADVVVEEMFKEGLRRDQDREKAWVALVDGAPYQIDLIEAEAKKQQVDIIIICDIIHVTEYLWKSARVFYKDEHRLAERWVNERFIAILEGKSSYVAAGIRRSATNRGLTGDDRKTIDKTAQYLLNKSPYLKYDQYLASGFPIATGVIEGAYLLPISIKYFRNRSQYL